MAEDSGEDKTEPASPRKLEEARKKGQIPRSHELSTFSILLTGLVALLIMGPDVFKALEQLFNKELRFDHATVSNPKLMLEHFIAAAGIALRACLPIFAACAVAALVTPVAIGGLLFTFETVTPNFTRMNPMNGLKRMFSMRAVVEAIKAILKSGLIGGVAAYALWNEKEQFIQLVVMPQDVGFSYLWGMVKHTLLMVVGAMAAIPLLDVPYQLWEYYKGLRMTKEEVKREYKESEGDPHIKGRIRQLQREAARKRMMANIPKADVIVTNPTHYAVALQYTEKMRAPVVVAKGAFLLAERIIELGREHKVAVIRTPPFARALYHHAELGEEIPAALYTAAAEVLAYIYQLQHYRKHGGLEPALSEELPVPPELDPEAPRP
ncbi:flagellar biosynthetic protein FlhB [Chitiniphilus shinanonensis]|uniref:Flagellar biosynthetic protein FlhB n=1 Tax=Chitiniphilus shinanonensis TaxID=553088 RepID=A0ABQ6BU71_9NEIS|nr:flagellar biosynthesis protein FlhB [Chitiniphilus shinanonensis]GLS05248.1 flagellar biosynthetic protein FlhB [Chitiniphilus shinanonensis]